MATERVLLTIKNVKESYPESPSEFVYGTLTLSLIEVPITSASGPSSSSSSSKSDSYLDLTLPSGRNLPAPASTRIKQLTKTLFQIESSPDLIEYLQSINDPAINTSASRILLDFDQIITSEPNSSKSTPITTAVSDIIELLQSIFAQFTIFADPNNSSEKQNVVLVDQNSGQTLGTLSNMKVAETQPLPDDKSPVILEVDPKSDVIHVRPATSQEQQAQIVSSSSTTSYSGTSTPVTTETTQGYGTGPGSASDPTTTILYNSNDTILSTAAGISRGLVFASSTVASGLDKFANWYTTTRAPTDKPLVFEETTKARVRKMSHVTGTGAHYSHKAVGAVQNLAASFGERLTARKEKEDAKKKGSSGGGPSEPKKPGLLNRSLIAFSTVLDGMDTATQTLVKGATDSSSKVVGHKYGPEAQELASDFGTSVKHVTTVYIDAKGVSRRAIIKGIGKGAVKGVVGNNKVVLVDEQQHGAFVKSAEQAAISGGPSGSGSGSESGSGSGVNTPSEPAGSSLASWGLVASNKLANLKVPFFGKSTTTTTNNASSSSSSLSESIPPALPQRPIAPNSTSSSSSSSSLYHNYKESSAPALPQRPTSDALPPSYDSTSNSGSGSGYGSNNNGKSQYY